jgi:hypothetical protein
MRRHVTGLITFGVVWLNCVQSGLSQGAIQYIQPATAISLHADFFAEYYSLDLDGDGNPDFTFAYDFHFIGVRPEGANRILTWLSPPPNIGGSIAPLPSGFVIGQTSESGSLQWEGRIGGDPTTDFNTLIQCFDVGCAGAFRGQHAYMGVEFQHAGGTNYGWVLLDIAPDFPWGQIEAWAWETRPGQPILAGAGVPEPSSSALLALALGVLAWWRRTIPGASQQ